jgi:hypothetical protein
MDRYPRCVKYLVLCLALLHTMTGGHLVCYAHSHLSQYDQHEHYCDHSYHQTSMGHLPTCCQDCPNDYKHVCDGQLAVRTLRSIDEAEKRFPPPPACVAFVPVMPQSVLLETIAASPSVCSLRLHLFYGVLLI